MKTNSLLQLLNKHKVVIPPIQRDYAQGRVTGKVPHIRARFLDAIVNTLANDQLPPLELDFIYGDAYKEMTAEGDEISFFKPLDGQQRLTTLFLIHWFVSVKEGVLGNDVKLLERFSYATRHSSRLFCEKLITFKPAFDNLSINKEIINQPWFFSAWLNDPTITSMLKMLQDIEVKFSGLIDIWPKLSGENPRIIFHLLPMEDLGLPDDLYIKMNSRGKELTDFEHFKSQFSEMLDADHAKVFNDKIDKEWSDMFWNIFKDKPSKDIAREVDGGFLSFFWFITDILLSIKNITPNNQYWLYTIRLVYSGKPDNIDFLFNSLNLFEKIEKDNPTYFDALFYIQEKDFAPEKTRLFFGAPQVNLFKKCCETYGYAGKANSFSVGEQLMLYAIIISNFNDYPDIGFKVRKLRNLFTASEDQLRNEYLSVFLYKDVEAILISNQLVSNSKLSKVQLKEEETKDNLILTTPALKGIIYKLEDHNLLRGSISIFDIDSTLPEYATWFHNIFINGCDYFEISRAMLTIGNYSQGFKKFRRFGNRNNSNWRDLLTQGESKSNFFETKSVIKEYLKCFINNPQQSNQKIISAYLLGFDNDENLPKKWEYYYIKYNSFRYWNNSQTQGYYYWSNYSVNPYVCMMLYSTQLNGRKWSPFLLELSSLNPYCSIENYGENLQFTKDELLLLIENTAYGFKFNAVDAFSKSVIELLLSDSKLDGNCVFEIEQNDDGIDLDDRILKINEFLNEISASYSTKQEKIPVVENNPVV